MAPVIGWRCAGREPLSQSVVDRVPKKGVLFVKPEMVAEVEYRHWPDDAQVQQAAFKGLREDKPARDVVRERRGA